MNRRQLRRLLENNNDPPLEEVVRRHSLAIIQLMTDMNWVKALLLAVLSFVLGLYFRGL